MEQQYEIINDWSAMTLGQAIEIYEVCEKAPAKLKKFLNLVAHGKTEEAEAMEFSEREETNTFPKFYGEVLAVLSNIPKKEINKMMYQQRTHIFNTYLFKFVIGLLEYPIDFIPQNLDKFEFNGEEYFLPASKDVLGTERPMGFISTIQFCEAADLDEYMRKLDKKQFGVFANIVAILCVKAGEEYDEDIMLKRAKEFEGLTMDIVWEVFFYLDQLLDMYTTATVTFFQDQVKLSMQKLPKAVE